jgi:hypothetical protein
MKPVLRGMGDHSGTGLGIRGNEGNGWQDTDSVCWTEFLIPPAALLQTQVEGFFNRNFSHSPKKIWKKSLRHP